MLNGLPSIIKMINPNLTLKIIHIFNLKIKNLIFKTSEDIK